MSAVSWQCLKFLLISSFVSEQRCTTTQGRNILECFAYPESPQYRFFKISAYPANFLANNPNGYLRGLGTVLYHQYICHEAPLTAEYRSDTIGVVVLKPLASQRLPGYGKQVQPAARAVPYVPVAAPNTGGAAFFNPAGSSAVALQQPFPTPGYLHQQGTVLQPSVYLQPFWAPNGYGNYWPTMGVLSAPQATAEKRGYERPSEDPSSEDQYPESSSDEGEQERLRNEEEKGADKFVNAK